MYWLLVPVAITAIVYYVFVMGSLYWEKKGVRQQNLKTLWIENIRAFMQMRPAADTMRMFYDSFANYRYAGMYQFSSPVLVLRDLDLIKQIAVRDFDYFTDHGQYISEEQDPLWGKNLFSLRGEKWRDMRATLSPSFTSSKMRAMFGFMTDCAEQFVSYFDKGDSTTITLEMKDAFTRYTNDVIASTAFGIQCDSLKEPENEFYLMGKEATNFRGFWTSMSFAIMFMSPTLGRLLGMQVFSKKVSSFFRKLVKENIEARENNGIIRPDMIHLLMEARKGRLKHDDHSHGEVDSGFAVIEESSVGKEEKHQKRQLSDDDVTAQALIFFFAGFETSSNLMCFSAYELAVNLDIQSKLQNEVDDTLKACGGKLTYEALLKMNYLDMVISETLRKWPNTIAADRVCIKPYTIQPAKDGEKPVHLEKDDVVWIPTFAIHRDPQYYPEPDRFDPERFSDENKANINPNAYLPFGVGPRSCIGSRFALLETKTVLCYILSKFNIVVVDKTTIPLKLATDQFNVAAEGGFWFGLKPRKMVK